MSFNVISALNDNSLSFIQIPNDLNEIVAEYNLNSKSSDACKNCPFNKEYYKLRMREKQLFGKKSEKSNKIEGQANADKIELRNRGQQPGKPGHGRGKHDRL